MSSSVPFANLFFRHRRRKQISAEGYAQGLEYQARHSGPTQAPSTGYAAQLNRDEYEALNQAEQYHAGRRFYSVNGPSYRTPPSWHEAAFAETPPILHTPPPGHRPTVEPEIDHETAAWLLRRFVNEAPGARRSDTPVIQDGTDIHGFFHPNRTVRMTIGEIHRHMAAQRAYADSVMAGDIVDAVVGGYAAGPSAEGAFASALSDAAASLEQAAAVMNEFDPIAAEFGDSIPEPAAGEIGSLEQALAGDLDAPNETFEEQQQLGSLDDLVEQEWQRLEPFAIQDPMELDPYDQFPPGMPMDPFGGMGPGM